MDMVAVRRAGGADLGALVPAYAGAVADEATNAWIFGAGAVPEVFMTGYLADFLRKSVAEDEVWIAERDGVIAGVSVWMRVDALDRFHAEADAIAAAAASTELPALRRAAGAARLVAETHPDAVPHMYLYSIAVLPEHRGSGAGGAMLRERLAIADADGVPAYLEASTEGSARLYERHGFADTGERHRLPEGGPALIPMWRAPLVG